MRICKEDGCEKPAQKQKNGYYSQCRTCRANKRSYGINTPERDQMLIDQGGVCLGCGSNIEFGISDGGKHSAVVDHCHKSGKVRGILCGSCNLALGKVYDSPNVLRRLAGYLEGR